MRIYQVDAFCKDIFSGNPAAICPLERWLDDTILQHIAAENNLAETAFYVREDNNFNIRWFTPSVEVDLCGHATLAAAHVLFTHEGFSGNEIVFRSRSGELIVRNEQSLLILDFPADELKRVEVTNEMQRWFSSTPIEAYKGKSDYLLVFSSQSEISNIKADLLAIEKLKDSRGVIVTAKGTDVDFVSRFFAPQSGIPEDPVTGSAHTSLTPYWSEKLQKKELSAVQLSPRKGFLRCKDLGGRVEISGMAKTYMLGKILLT